MRIFLMGYLLLVIVTIVLTVIMCQRTETATQICNGKKGVLVKTPKGLVCIDVRTL